MEDQEYRAILEQLVCPDYGVLASLRPYCLPRKKSQDFASFFQMNIWSKVMNESDKTWFVYAVFKE